MSEQTAARERDFTIGDAMALANQALRSRQFEAALQIYRQVLQVAPDYPDALHFSGLIAFQQDRDEEAVALIRRSLQVAPDFAGYWNNYGNVLKELGHLEEATSAYEKAVALQPDFADAHHNLGVLARQRDDLEGAIAEYEKALAVDANRPDTCLNLGNALEKLDRLDESASAFQRAIDLKPDNPAAFAPLGHLRFRQGRLEEAIEAVARVINLEPKDPRSYTVLAGIFHMQGRVDEAFEVYERALAIDPKSPSTNLIYGQLLAASGRADDARKVWQRWLELDPTNPIPRHHLQAGADETVPERSDNELIVHIFDDFADSFDKKLRVLEYKAPEFIGEAVRDIYGEPKGNLVILDAGCGTGLCGPMLRPYASRLDGVDLSGKMLEKAKARGGYDELVEAELTAFIASRKDAYDVIASADTLCYFGKLEGVLTAARESLRPGGRFIFTLEKTPADKGAHKVTLEHSGRYTHTEEYARSATESTGLKLVRLDAKVLRTEFLKPVHGMLVVVEKL